MPKLGEAYIVYKSKGLDKLHTDIGGAGKAFKVGSAAIIASVAAISAAVVKIGVPFEQMVVDAGSAMRATTKEMEALEAAARKAGATTEHTATQAAESLMFLGKAGLSAGQAMQALPGMMNFKTAIGDLMSLGQATDVITDSMTAMGLEVKDLNHLTDLFIGVSNRSSINVAQVGESFTKVAGIARLYGMEVEDLTSLLGVLGGAGIKAELAGTGLKNAFINTSRAAAELGIENKGLIETLKAVKDANWDADQIAASYGKIALPSVVAILKSLDGSGPGSLSYFQEELAGVSDGMGEAAIQAEKMRATVGNQFKIVISQVEDLALSIFENWKPAMLEGIAATQDFLAANKTAIVSVGDILLPLLKDVGMVLATGAQLGVDSIGLLNASMIGFVDVTNRGFIEIEHAGKVAWAGLQTGFGVVMGEMFKIFESFVTLATEVSGALGMDEMESGFKAMSAGIKAGVSDMNDLAGAIGRATEERRNAITAHEKIIESMELEKQGYTETAAAGRKAAEEKLAFGRSVAGQAEKAAKKQIADLIKIAEAETKVSKKITKIKKASVKETEKAQKARIREIEKANKQIIRDREQMAKEMERLESGQIKEFEKQLETSQGVYQDFIKDQLGIKELSVESMAAIDARYSEIREGVLSGEIESFDSAMTDILTAKETNLESLKEFDTAYSIFLAEQEAENKRIRMDFFETTGGMSTEYFAKLAGDIEAQAGVWQKAGVDAVSVEEWKLEQFRALDMQRLESSDKFFDGVKLGMMQSQQDMMTWADAGKNIFGDFQSTLAGSFNQLFNGLIRGDMASLSGAWDSLWSGMLDTVVSNLSQMAAEWASQQIAGLAISGASALSSAIFAKDGAFDVGRTGPGTEDPRLGGAIPILAHAGESIIDAETTEKIKSATSWEEFSGAIRSKFGIGENDGGLWDRASEYSGTGANLFKAWQAFDSGDTIGGITEAMNAMSDAFTTYGKQYGSQAATNMGASLSDAAGAVGTGYSAFTAFENKDYVTGTVQALQTAQQVSDAYNALSATTAAAETGGAAASTTGGTALSSVGYISGAGYGLAGNAIIGAVMSDTRRSGEENPAMVGKAVSAIVGAAASATGPLGSAILGGIAGQLVGTGLSLGGGYNTQTYTLTELDAGINDRRTFDPDFGIGFSGAGVGNNVIPPDAHPYATVVNPYLEALDRDTVLINSAIAEIAGGLGESGNAFLDSLGQQDWSVRSSQRGYEESNFTYGEAGDAVTGLAAIAWNDSIDNLVNAATTAGADAAIISSLTDARRDEVLPTLAEARESFLAQQAQREALAASELYSYNADTGTAEFFSGGAATGGIIEKGPEDGSVRVTHREGILNVDEMGWIRKVGKNIEKSPGNGIGIGEVVNLLSEILVVLTRSEGIQESMASRSGEIDFEALAESLAPALESGTGSGRFEFTAPDVRRATDRVNQGRF